MSNIIIIPARLESKRLPGKPLFPVGNKTILQMVYEQCCKSNADKIYIAIPPTITSSILLEKDIQRFTDKSFRSIIFTGFDGECKTGTQRVADAVKRLIALGLIKKDDCIINVQVDYPTIDPELINNIFKELEREQSCVTAGYICYDTKKLSSRDSVKVVYNIENKCLYFSRKYITNAIHIGIYGFSDFQVLNTLGNLVIGMTDLEQIPWLHSNKYPIKLVCSETEPLAINTLEDYKQLLQDQ